MNNPYFHYQDQQLQVEAIPLAELANRFGTPCYVYSRAALNAAYDSYRAVVDGPGGHPTTLCYAVKANSNLAILNLFARLGAGFDIVSGGELQRVLAAGGDPAKVVFSGVAKSVAEIRQALQAGIHCFNVESSAELARINEVAAALDRRAPISLRVNPHVDAKTHPYISTGLKSSKFGVPHDEALALYRQARTLSHIDICGIDCHIGSQLLDPAPAAEAATRILELADALAAEGMPLKHIDLGGGMGIRYRDEAIPSTAEYLAPLLRLMQGRPERLLLEPGRSLVGNAGVLLTRIEYLKPGSDKNFAIIDAAMNDLMRPALYDAWHDILPVSTRPDEAPTTYNVVGPICESGDFIGKERTLALRAGDLLAVMSAGAYGMTMSSNYNTRARAAEVMVDGTEMHLIRQRETISELYAHERLLPD